jgi:hypothetical protein
MDKATKLSLLSLLVVAGFAVGVGYHYVQGVYLGQPYPRNTFLYDPAVHGSDFADVMRDGHTLNPYIEHSSAQYPFLALVGFVFSLLPGSPYALLLAIVSGLFLAFSAASLWLDSWHTSAIHVFVIAFLSYPFLFAIDRGNFELLVFVLLLAFLFFFARKQHAWSALCLGLAIALKLYPVVLLALYFPAKNFRAMLVGLASAVAATLASLLCFKGGFLANAAYLLQARNLQSNYVFHEFTSLSSNMVQRGVSLLTLLKLTSIEAGLLRGVGDNVFLSWYLAISALVGVFVVIHAVFVEKELWRRVALLVLAMLLLPHISADYKLLLIYLPLYLFVNSDTRSRLDVVFVVLFGLLLIPKDYYYLPHAISDAAAGYDISIAVPANILLLLLMGLFIVGSGLANWSRHNRDKEAPVDVQSPER